MKIIKIVHGNEVLPRGYGVAWQLYAQNAAVCMPMPLNVLARVGYRLLTWVAYGSREVAIDSREAYAQGRADGRRDANRDEIEHYRAQWHRAVALIKHGNDEVCMCGDSLENHMDAFSCGHSPVSVWDYYAGKIIDEAEEDCRLHGEPTA